MNPASRSNPKYIYDLPYFERIELCRILDQNDKWEELGGIHMNFDVLTIQTLRREILRGNSPADELLTKWGHQNHTILELFVLLSKMQHYQAMLTIKQFVEPEYHRLIYEGEQNLSRIFKTRANATNPRENPTNQGITTAIAASSENRPLLLVSQKVKEAINLHSNKSEGGKDHISFTDNAQARNINETKILNNEFGLEPNKTKTAKNSNAQTILVNKDENAMADKANDLKPKLLKDETAKDKNVSEISSIAESVGTLPVITFRELEIATNGWDQSTILGKGGFGTVYKGTWKNTQVAIKRTKNSDTNENRSAQIQQILGELKILNSYRHDNILPLYGYSLGSDDPCLIYQYMPNGSVEDRLLCRHGTKPLSWFQRHNIAVGTARGLQFLHTIGEKPLIHGDIKSANILLDLYFEPKIGDFGLAREGPYSHYTHMKVSKVHGTRPYLPDEFLRHKKFSIKVDTHSFGVVLFELAVGLRAYDDQRAHKFLKDLVENSDEQELIHLMDKKCGPDEQIFSNLIALGKCCTSRRPKDRPEMVTVLQHLNKMTVKKDATLRVRPNGPVAFPTNLHEAESLHEHLTLQKKIATASSSAMHRAVSPSQAASFIPETNRTVSPSPPTFPTPETNRAVSPKAHEFKFLGNHNPFIPFDPLRNPQQEVRSVSPGVNVAPEGDRSPGVKRTAGSDAKPPLISVVPPSESQSSSEASDEDTCSHSDANKNKDFDYSYSSQFDNVLPLISELGIKSKSQPSKTDH